ncbi:MAG: SRPBCC domain-containing protein [Candidatus Korobacteraceae bacterium]
MTVDSEHRVRITRHFDASPERVFDAWLDPESACKWLFATPSGQMTRVEIDARVGGKFVIVERRDGEDVDHVGEYLEIDPPRRLVFSFAVPKYSSQSTRVSIDIAPAQAGCDLTLTHEGVLAEWADRTQQGWSTILDGLAGTCEGSSGGYGAVLEAGTIRFERLLPGPIERVWAYLTEPDKRAKWLASGEMEPRVGAPLDLKFHHSSLSRNTAPIPEKYKNQEEGQVTQHTVTRFEPPRLLGLTWGSGKEGPSEVTFELTPQGDKVLLVLTHRRLRDRKAMLAVASGWHSHLAVLVDRLAGREPDAFWSVFAKVNGEYEKRLPPE